MKTKAVHICGTGSGVGKSVLVTALCRIFMQEGYKVCPFKAQNMALNSFVTREGEIGRAQATQAQACGIEPSVDMNPILIKPSSDTGAQIIVRGKPVGNMDVLEYIKYKKKAVKIVQGSYNRLKKEYDLIVMEGAGSPAEINLKKHDIVNMKMAEFAGSPVLLVGDIDKGGVFASLYGTVSLLNKKEQKRIKGLIINKFRGDKSLLEGGIKSLEKKTNKKVMGVVPYFSAGGIYASGMKDINLPEEDSLYLETRNNPGYLKDSINISVIKLPHISNFTDFDSLESEKNVMLKYAVSEQDFNNADIIILPGTKNTIGDFVWLKTKGLTEKIKSRVDAGSILIGICGGFQMLGRRILDPYGIESAIKETHGLELIDMVTTIKSKKKTFQVKAKELVSGMELNGYEIHHGETKIFDGILPFCEIKERLGKSVSIKDGARNKEWSVWGTYIHGIFDNAGFRKTLLDKIRLKKKMTVYPDCNIFNQNQEFDKLAHLVRENIDMDYLYRIIDKEV